MAFSKLNPCVSVADTSESSLSRRKPRKEMLRQALIEALRDLFYWWDTVTALGRLPIRERDEIISNVRVSPLQCRALKD